MIMQEMWIVRTRWDKSLTDDLCMKVRKLFDKLITVTENQSLQKNCIVQSINLHAFVDALQDAYGAVVYLRIEYDNQTISLVAPKTRVTPLHLVQSVHTFIVLD